MSGSRAMALGLASAREHFRFVERFSFRALAEAETEDETREAESLRRLVVGTKRKLDNYRVPDSPDGPPDTRQEE